MENGESSINLLTDEIVYYYPVGRVCVSRTQNTVAISLECRYVIFFFLDLKVNHLSSKAKNIKNITKESWINLFLFSSYSSYKVSYILIFLNVLFSTKYVARMVNMIH